MIVFDVMLELGLSIELLVTLTTFVISTLHLLSWANITDTDWRLSVIDLELLILNRLTLEVCDSFARYVDET